MHSDIVVGDKQVQLPTIQHLGDKQLYSGVGLKWGCPKWGALEHTIMFREVKIQITVYTVLFLVR